MRRLLSITAVITTLVISPVNGSATTTNPTAIVTQHPTATPNAPAHAKHKRTVKSKVQRAVLFGMNDDDDDVAQSEDIATGYRRRDLNKIEHNDGISEQVRWRLFLARQLALLKHREFHQKV